MIKELTPLQEINKPICIEYTENSANDKLCYRRYQVDIIETALKKYKVLQEVHKDFVDKNIKKLKECYKNELKNTAYYNNLALKYKKAVEIIKEKVLDMDYFNIIADNCNLTYQEYNLLMEVLK